MRLGIHTKLSLGFGLALALIVAVGLFALLQIRQVNEAAHELREGWLPRVERLGEIRRLLTQYRSLIVRQTQTTNYRHLAEITRASKDTKDAIDAVLQGFEARLDLREERWLWSAFIESWEAYGAVHQTVIERLETGDIALEMGPLNEASIVAFREADALLDRLLDFARQESQRSADRAAEIYRLALWLTLAAALFAALCLVGAVLWTRRRISAPILRIAETMRRLSEGDVAATLAEGRREDEIGTLAQATAHYRDSLIQGRALAARIEAERQRLDAAVRNMSQGLSMYDAEHRLIVSNPRLEELYPCLAGALRPGMHMVEVLRLGAKAGLYGSRTAEEIYAERASAVAAGPASFHHQQPDGRTLALSYVPLPGGGWLATYDDVSEQQAREAAFRRAKEEAERASRAKSESLALMSHELRTPLNAILGFSELIRDGLRGPDAAERYREYAGDIHSSGSHLLRIINDLLDLAKIDAGKFELAETWLDLAEEAGAMARMLEGQAEAAGLRLETAIAEGAASLYADPRALKQIMVNLVSNAIKFTPQGGCVRIASRRRDDGRVELAVSDTGVGMSEADIPRALERFGQVDGVLSRRHEGAGLGLPIVRALARLHGAKFRIASAPGRGTVVALRFPPERLPAETASGAPPRRAVA